MFVAIANNIVVVYKSTRQRGSHIFDYIFYSTGIYINLYKLDGAEMLCILTPYSVGFQKLLHSNDSVQHDIVFNTKKIVVMIVQTTEVSLLLLR